VEEMKVNMIWLIRKHSIFREKEMKVPESVEEKLCSVILLCLHLAVKYQPKGHLAASNQLLNYNRICREQSLIKVATDINK
jgi:hypothetical protein